MGLTLLLSNSSAVLGATASAPFTPASLAPRAWYDAHLGGSATQITDSSGNGRAAATFGAGSNSPLWLQYAGVPYVYCHAGGQRVYTSNIDLVGTTEMDMRLAFAADDWTPAASQVMWAHGSSTASTGTFRVFLLAGGTLRLDLSDLTSYPAFTSTAALGLTDGAIAGIRVTWRSSDGRIQFFTKTIVESTAAADIASNTGWTQVGANVTGTAAARPTVSAPLGFTSYGATAATAAAGRLYAGQFATVIDGTPAYTFDATSCGQGGYTGGGTTWTIGRTTTGRKAVVLSPAAGSARSVCLLGTDDWIDVPAGAFVSGRTAPASVVTVVRAWATPTASGRFYDSDNSGLAVLTNGTAQQGRALYNAVGANAAAHTSGQRLALLAGYDPGTTTLSAGQNSDAYVTATVAAAASDPTAARVGATTAGANVQNFELSAVLTFDRVLSLSELAAIHAFYGGL